MTFKINAVSKVVMQVQKHRNHHGISGNEKGMVLIVTLILIAVLSLLATTAVMIINTDLKIASNYREDAKALYQAEAGVEQVIAYLRSNGIVYPITSEAPLTMTLTVPVGFSFNASVVLYFAAANTYHFQMTGTAANNASKTIEATISRTNIVPQAVDGAVAMYGSSPTLTLKGGGSGINVDGHDYPLPSNFECTGSACETSPGSSTVPGLYTITAPTISGTTSNLDGTPPSKVGEGVNNEQAWIDFVEYVVANNLADVTGGTRTAPKITVVSSGSRVSGSAHGAGILIIRDGGIYSMPAGATFEGLIILEGTGAVTAAGTSNIYGSVITIRHARKTIDCNSIGNLRYSSQARSNVNLISKLWRIQKIAWLDVY
jgi:hypothetical protein